MRDAGRSGLCSLSLSVQGADVDVSSNSDSRLRYWWLLGGSLLLVAVVGVIYLNYPFMGDQALFVVFARMMDHGAVLYRDIWDIKQPAIFVFYLVAGKAFGFSEAGVHLLELLMWLGFSGAVSWLLRARMRTKWTAALFPFLFLGSYYAAARPGQLTQIEALVGPFLFAAGWLTLPRGEGASSGRGRLFLAGVAGGVVLTFKLMLGIILAAVWVLVLVEWVRRRGGVRAAASKLVLPVLAGVAVPILVAVVYFAAKGQLGLLWSTTFVYPPQFIGVVPRPTSRLLNSLKLVGGFYFPLLALAGYHTWRAVRRGLSRLDQMLLLWLVAGFLTFVLQLWWSYLLLVGLVPVAVLAVEGLDDLVSSVRRRNLVLVGSFLLLTALPSALNLGTTVSEWIQSGATLPRQGTDEFKASLRPGYADAARSVAFLEAEPEGAIYVLGDPTYLYLSGRDQAAAINGWSPEMLTPELWKRLADQLNEARPSFFYVAGWASEWVVLRSPAVGELIGGEFSPYTHDESGTWYKRVGGS